MLESNSAANGLDSRKEESMNNQNQQKITILYARLSRDDGEDGVSNSIVNQQKLLEEYAERNGLKPFSFLCDDGWSGTRWDRPGWQELMAKVEADEVCAIIVKDSSRIGRDYLRVGLFRETLHEKGVRLIAVNDGIDSFRSDDDFTPFREIMAEWFARDCSRKIKAVYHHQGMSGVRLLHHPLYGYKKADDTVKNSQWVIDKYAATIVRRIFSSIIVGQSVRQIALQLSAEKVECPSYYLAQLGYGHNVNKKFDDPYRWWDSSVYDILLKVEYMGHTVNFKTKSKSFKSKKRYETTPDEQMIFENTHEALVDKDTWELANQIRNSAKRHVSRFTGETHPLTGLMFCAQCGGKMYHQRRKPTTKNPHNDYTCANYRKITTGITCTPHRIIQPAIEELILATLRHISTYAVKNPAEFKRKVSEMFSANLNREVKSQKKRLTVCEKRVAELDKLIMKLFEEYTLDNMQEKRFNVLSEQYEKEQTELESEITVLQSGIDSYVDSTERADKFLALAKRYTDFTELTTPMLNEFVRRVEVHERKDKKCHHTEQKVDIYLKFIDDFIIPPESVELTEEEIKCIKHSEKVQARREYYREYYRKCKENGGKPLKQNDTRTPGEKSSDGKAWSEKRKLQTREWRQKIKQEQAEESDFSA